MKYNPTIRNEKSYQYIVNYIVNNPANWEKDKFYFTKFENKTKIKNEIKNDNNVFFTIR